MTRTAPASTAKYVADRANDWATSHHRRVTVAKVRSLTSEAGGFYVEGYGLDLKTSSIYGGSQFVGRHKLLEHPLVWTVFVRNGKAVAHRVR